MNEPAPIPFTIRPAVWTERWVIRRLVWRAGINPTGLDWRRFRVAVDPQGRLLGCGQVKPHSDGSRELASIAVQPFCRGQGIAGAVIRRLQDENPPPLYLICRAPLGSFYTRFGFVVVTEPVEAPPHFRRMLRVIGWLSRLFPGRRPGLVMRWDGP